MLRNAATAIVAIYGTEAAAKQSFNMGGHRLQQSEESALEDFALSTGYNFSNLNRGMMSQMQSDPSDTDNDCYYGTVATNAEIMVMADFSAYTLGGFDAATFLELFKVFSIKLM
jgi:hypothetical protein